MSQPKLRLVINWAGLEETLPGTTAKEKQEFIRCAENYALDQGYDFEVVRQPGLYFNVGDQPAAPYTDARLQSIVQDIRSKMYQP